MYRCDNCEGLSKPGERINRVIKQVRPVNYIDQTRKILAQGQEIVEEIAICASCQERRDVAEEAAGTIILPSNTLMVKNVTVKNLSKEGKDKVNSRPGKENKK
jgi:hypothetical protein